MNIRLPLVGRAILVVVFLILGLRPGLAATTTTIFSEDFSGYTFPPDGWVDNSYDQWTGGSGWYYAYDGYDGSNGSAICDIWNGSTGELMTPTMDASIWNATGDTAFVDFDFFWEYNDYNLYYGSGIDDNFQMYLVNPQGQTQVLNLYTSSDYTYFNDSYDFITDPPTSTDAWRHYHIGIPKDYRVSGFQVAWQAVPNFGAGNAAIDNVVVSGTHYNTVTITPTSPINFGTLNVGDTSYRGIVIQNPNPITVNLSNINVTGSDYTLVRTPSTIAANSKDSIVIAFVPTLGGTRSGTVSFNTDADQPTSASFNLIGIGVSPILALSTGGPLFYHTHVKLGSSLTQSIVVSNATAGLLRISPATNIGGDYPGEYSITNLPEGGIAVGGTDTIKVTYHPTLEGLHPATLNIISNGGDTSISMLGVGTLPRLVVTPMALNFAPVPIGTQECQPVTLSNPGTDTLQIRRDFFSSHDYDFTLTPLAGNDTIIPPGATKTVTVCFTPLRSGTRVATLHIATNIPMTNGESPIDTSGFDVSIQGIGLAVGQLAFGIVPDSTIIGQTECVTDTIFNVGQADITVTSATFAGADSSEFNFGPNTFPLTIPAGGSAKVTVCFAPNTRGLRTALVEFVGTSEGTTVRGEGAVQATGLLVCANQSTLSLFDSTTTLIGMSDTQMVVITNCGDVPTTYTAALSGSGYTLVGPATSGTIAPGATDAIRVVFTPTGMTPSSGTLTVTGGNGLAPLTVALGGMGGGVTISATGEPAAGTVGIPETFTVTVTNNGNVAWTPGTASITGTNSADFTVQSQLTPAVIPAGGSATMTIQFTPSVAATETAMLSFPSEAPLPSPAFDYALTGTAATNGVGETSVNGFSLNAVYPNPVKQSATIAFTMPTASVVNLTIVDGKGTMVRSLANGMMSEGDHTISLSVTDLASGTYFCHFQSGNVSLVRELVVQK